MNTVITDSWVKFKSYLNQKDYDLIHSLQEECVRNDRIALKLELEYKLEDAANTTNASGVRDVNEFLYFDGEQLIGYIGICVFGGTSAPFEMTGMVHPAYRRRGIFTKLLSLAMAECRRRKAAKVLALCDRNSVTGQAFMKQTEAAYQYSEFEMYLRNAPAPIQKDQLHGLRFRKASNADAGEIKRQNVLFFGEDAGEGAGDETDQSRFLPEEEEKRGMMIYLVEKDEQIIGKVHIELLKEVGGIYGLGVLPEFRAKGYGREILLEAIKKLQNAKAKEIMLQVAAGNAKALGLYKSCGFQETSVMDYYSM